MSRMWAATMQLTCFSCRHRWFLQLAIFITVSKAMTGIIRTIGLVCLCNLHEYLFFHIFLFFPICRSMEGLISHYNVSTNIRLQNLTFLWLHKYTLIRCSSTTYADRIWRDSRYIVAGLQLKGPNTVLIKEALARLQIHCWWPRKHQKPHTGDRAVRNSAPRLLSMPPTAAAAFWSREDHRHHYEHAPLPQVTMPSPEPPCRAPICVTPTWIRCFGDA